MEDKCWWSCGVIGILIHCFWECKMVQPLWKTAWYFLSKLNLQVSYDSAISCLGMHKDLKICVQTKNFYMTLCSGTINNCQKLDIWETTQVSINRWMNKYMRYSHNTEYYWVIKRNKALIHATTWMNFENIMLSDRSWIQNVIYCIIPCIWNVKNG